MSLQEHLFEIERGFWIDGFDYFAAHLADQCLLAYPQSQGMHGLFSREEVAATATGSNRWRDLEMSDRQLLKLSDDVATVSYTHLDVYKRQDLASIPQPLISKVEVVTGGASAVYGSDAIGGVVNFILKDDFEGI